MKKLSILIILALMILNVDVLAVANDNLPIYDDFDSYENMSLNKYKTGYSASNNNAKNHYAKIENGKIKASINKEESGTLRITKSLETPFTGEKFSMEFDMMIEGDSYIYSYIGVPIIIDSDGVEMPIMKITNAKEGYTVPGDRAINVRENSLKDTYWESGINYKIKADVNLENKTYELFIDKGDGYEKKETLSGDSTFSFKARNISGFSFVFLGNSANAADYYIDNIKVTTPYEYIYVSTDGDDSNDGSFKTPVKTLEKAYSLAKEIKTLNNKDVFVRVLSGEYAVDEQYTIGSVNENTDYGKISFAPDNDAEISFSGNVKVDIPEVESFQNGMLKESFLKDIRENYISGYNAKPLEIGKVNFKNNEDESLSSSLWVSNSGRVDSDVCMVSALYDTEGKLLDVDIKNETVSAGERIELSSNVKFEGKYDNYTVKTYLWQDLEGMIPIFNMQLASDLQVNIKNSNIYDVKTVIYGEQVDLNMKAEAGDRIALKMTNESGKIVYMNQLIADENGNVSYKINPQYMPAGVVTLHIQSNGGGNK